MAEAVAEEAKTKKRSFGKILLLGINVLLFLSGAAFFLLTKFGFLASTTPAEPLPAVATQAESTAHGTVAPTKSAHGAKESAKAAPGPSSEAHAAGDVVTMSLQPFVVNLSGDNGRRYLRVVMQLQLKGSKAKEDIEKNIALMRDRLIFLLSSKTFEDISSAQGKYQLQGEISKSINEALGATVVEKTYFTEFVVQ
jgi:flagellar protein FliL